MLRNKRTKKKLIVRQFQKWNSVFRDWMPDTKENLRACFRIDMSHSKLRKVINNDKQYGEIFELLLSNLEQLKEIFVHCVGVSSFPYISWLEFTRLASKWDLPGMFPHPSSLTFSSRRRHLPNVNDRYPIHCHEL